MFAYSQCLDELSSGNLLLCNDLSSYDYWNADTSAVDKRTLCSREGSSWASQGLDLPLTLSRLNWSRVLKCNRSSCRRGRKLKLGELEYVRHHRTGRLKGSVSAPGLKIGSTANDQ